MVEGTDLRLLKVDDNEATFETGERMLGEDTLVGDERIDEGEDTDELTGIFEADHSVNCS